MPEDICAYIRALLWTLVLLGLLSVIGGVFLFIMLMAFWEEPIVMGSIITTVAIVVIIVTKYGHKHIYLPKSEMLEIVYESIHDKVCFRVGYTDERR